MGEIINTETKITDKNLRIEPDWLKYISPFSLILAGNSQSGKTTFVFELIDNINKIVTTPPDEIYYLFSVDQPIYEKYKHKINFTKDIEILNIIPEDNTSILIVIDDLGDELIKSAALMGIFTKHCHHRRISVILILQNLFIQSPNYVTLRQNACYFGFADLGMNLTGLNIFASRLGGKEMAEYLKKAYKATMIKKHQILMLDNHPLSVLRRPPFEILCRTNTNYLIGQVLFLPNK